MQLVNHNIVNTTARYIIHGCNAQGKMGAGVALEVRKKWPEVFRAYSQVCKLRNAEEIVGTCISTPTNDGHVIGNLITQKYYGRGVFARPSWIQSSIVEFITQFRPEVIASPKIGCGLGGLLWADVSPIYKQIEEEYNVEFFIYDNRPDARLDYALV